MTRPRVGLIGARRVRQGLGPFVARDLVAAGAEVPCFLATRAETVEPARTELRKHAAVDPRGYCDVDAMLAEERLDALAILSPAETHERYLHRAADEGLHVLCEKPLVFGGLDLATRAASVVRRFEESRLLLVENSQWPRVLEAFAALFPERKTGERPRSFRMRLAPASAGVNLLGDCVPHPLSLLDALAPAERVEVERVRFEEIAPDASGLRVRLSYRADDTEVDVELELAPSSTLPRPAWLEIDGLRAERKITLPGYTMELEDPRGRRVPVPDPLAAHVRSFVSELSGVVSGEPPPDPSPIARRMRLLDEIVAAFPGATGPKVDGPEGAGA